MRQLILSLGALAGSAVASYVISTPAWSFENTKVLPAGIRSLSVKSVTTSLDYKSDATGSLDPLAKPLMKDLTFEKVLHGESGLKKTQLEAFLLNEGFPLEASLGSFTADMQGGVSVLAPIFSYGLSEKFTLAFALPYYQARMNTSLGFIPSANGHRLVERLHDPQYNKTKSAREVADKLNNAVGELNDKLSDHGFKQLGNWQGSGFGDATLAGKYQLMDESVLKMASTSGLVLPTGRMDDPDLLNDIPFGKGTYDIFSSLILDEYVGAGLFFNQYAKYSYSLADERSLRMATADEAIEVEKRTIGYKLGDRFEAGASLQFEPAWGLVAGLGYVYSQKMADRYAVPANVANQAQVKDKLEAETKQRAHHLEAKFGYSGVGAYQRGEIAVPFAATVEYKKHLASVHSVSNDFVALDLALYF